MQLSAGAGESGDKRRAIKRLKKFAYSATIISWIRRFCHGFFSFVSMTIFCYLPQKSPRATFCHLLCRNWIVIRKRLVYRSSGNIRYLVIH